MKDSPVKDIKTATVGITPDDFTGIQPKLEVKAGDMIEEGQPLLHDKRWEDVKICSPTSGIVQEIRRGERRKILQIIIERKENSHEPSPNRISSENIRKSIMEAGLWVYMRQLPYATIPDGDKEPRDIFVTAFDSSPLSGDLLMMPGVNQENISSGIETLSSLTSGDVYISTRENFPYSTGNAKHIIIEGAHPAGLASIQAGNIKPVNKGETVWLLDIVTLSKIGEFVRTGRYTHETIVAVTGSEVREPFYVRTDEGAQISPILKDEIKDNNRNIRIISGNVLTGYKITEDGFLRFPYRQLTIIPEGDDKNEFMGWASLSPSKLSTSNSFPLSKFRKKFSPDARLNGGKRAMIMSEKYDKMIPLDILPEYLIKAILSKNIDKMEQLGIYEVSPEDFALAEFVDPSKLELQKIVREGLDYLKRETE